VSNQYILMLKMSAAMFAKTLANFQHLTWLIPES
jgi:hypothetical protein